ncbi:MAG TPA: hypothetical protein VGG49_13135 [Steroidobacteraceae bacterium]|jgi:hypothetical protein
MTTTKQQSPLVLDDAPANAKKISNNLLNFGTEKVPAFTIPMEGLQLLEAAVDRLFGKYTFRSWFNQDAQTLLWSPMPWWSLLEGGTLKFSIELALDDVEILVEGATRSLLFEHDQDSEGKDRPIGKISGITAKALVAGIVELGFSLTLRPGLGEENLGLQENQYKPVLITLGDTRLIQKPGDKQQSLDLKPPGAAPAPEAAGSPPATDVSNGEGQPASGDVRDHGAVGEHLEGPSGDGPEGLTRLEENLRKQTEAVTARPGQVVDGTTAASRATRRSRVDVSPKH